MGSLRVGVVGLGRMGQHHARCSALAQGVQFTGACDLDPARQAALAPGTFFTTDLPALLERADAVILAVPTDRHAALGAEILRAGKHLLVEKPLAASAAECDALVRESRRAGRVLGVGHVERMNGAWRAVRGRLDRPLFAEGHRLAGFDPRGTEVDVILDLMIHDLDLVLDAFGEEPHRVEAVGVAVLTDRVDIANARLEFGDGALAGLTASRVSREPVRKLRLFQADAYFSVDFRTQEAEIVAKDPGKDHAVTHETLRAPDGHNPLVREIEAFAAAARGERSDLVTPEAGTRAVRLAGRILESIESRRRLWAADPAGVRWGVGPSWS